MIKKADMEFLPDNSEYLSVQENIIESQILDALNGNKVDNELIDKYLSDARCNLYRGFHIYGRVLEIGALYGSITNYLCANSKEVFAIEMKESRKEIILKRCEQYNNLIVQIGNLSKIFEMSQFDCIIVHDVVGLIKKFYLSSNNGLLTFINELHNILNDEGYLYIDFENSLGIKYFAGAIEEYSKKRYTSLNGFKNYSFLKTYSREEIEIICQESLFKDFKFYYPFPNSYFPSEVHSDFSLKYLNFSTYATKQYDNDFVEYDWIDLIKSTRGNNLKCLNNHFFVELSKKHCQTLIYSDYKTKNTFATYFYNGDKIEKRVGRRGIYDLPSDLFSRRIDTLVYHEIKKARLIDNENIANIFIKYFDMLYKHVKDGFIDNMELNFRDIFINSDNSFYLKKITKLQFSNIVNSLVSNFYFFLSNTEYRELRKYLKDKYDISVMLDDFSMKVCQVVNPIIEEADYFEYVNDYENKEILKIKMEKALIMNSKLFGGEK